MHALVPSLFGGKAVSVLPGTVRFRVLPPFALSYLGQSWADLYSPLPYSGTSYWWINMVKAIPYAVRCMLMTLVFAPSLFGSKTDIVLAR